jgi:protocatechuate 3,4-dioxygenase beta subunit
VQVYLVESPANDPLSLPIVLQRGLLGGPLASSRTGADGRFALGLQLADERLYELHFLGEHHADAQIGGLRVLPADWRDVGTVTLHPGARLHGRVTVAGTDLPAPGAVVTIDVGTTFEDAVTRSLPRRERGLAADVDLDGNYEFRHVPARGMVRVAAVAPGFARVERNQIELRPRGAARVDLALLPGLSITGSVRDPLGQPVARARVEAWPVETGGNPLLATTRVDGTFVVLGLVAGKHRLRVLARGFHDLDQEDVAAGRFDVQVVLQPRHTVRVTARGPDGQVLRRYQLAVRRWFAEQGQIGVVADLREQRVRLDGLTDHVDVPGVPAGTFVCQVSAEGAATALSEPFTTSDPAAGTMAQRHDIEVRLTTGASLRGRIVDANGRALAGATVTTQADGANPDDPVWRLLAGVAPLRITATTTTTDADGAFRMALLAHGRYQLQVDHPEACRHWARGIDLATDGERTLPPIEVPGGAVVQGKATVGGKSGGQIQVVVRTATAPNSPGPAAVPLRLETVTDSSGAFRLPRRLAPGTYELKAAAGETAEPEAQIFRQLLQLQRSTTIFQVAPGQLLVELNIDLPSDH